MGGQAIGQKRMKELVARLVSGNSPRHVHLTGLRDTT